MLHQPVTQSHSASDAPSVTLSHPHPGALHQSHSVTLSHTQSVTLSQRRSVSHPVSRTHSCALVSYFQPAATRYQMHPLNRTQSVTLSQRRSTSNTEPATLSQSHSASDAPLVTHSLSHTQSERPRGVRGMTPFELFEITVPCCVSVILCLLSSGCDLPYPVTRHQALCLFRLLQRHFELQHMNNSSAINRAGYPGLASLLVGQSPGLLTLVNLVNNHIIILIRFSHVCGF